LEDNILMKTKILLFGGFKTYFDAEYELALDEDATGESLIKYFLALEPEAGALFRVCSLALNGELVAKDARLNNAKEIVFLPPFSGG
jgi:molybdopterin converting factor small subunit